LRKQGDTLSIQPCIPRSWPGFKAMLRHGAAHYDIVVENPEVVSGGVLRIVVDGMPLTAGASAVRLVDDGRRHSVVVTLGAAQAVLQ
jgi:cyclic beta-1,2-glucan synthetase